MFALIVQVSLMQDHSKEMHAELEDQCQTISGARNVDMLD